MTGLLVQLAWLAAPLPFVSVPDAAKLRDAVVLDARASAEFARGHVPGAVRAVDESAGVAGGRSDAGDEALTEAFARLGVDERRPVVVYGAGDGGEGEEGRVWWWLRYLGHPDVRLLDGGWPAWQRAGGAHETGAARTLPAGRFRARPVRELLATVALVERALADGTVLLDVRGAAEWAGATPHGETRGGHLPGARHFEWRRLFQGGTVFSPDPARADALRAELARLNVTPRSRVIVYCAGGARSGYVQAALFALGFRDVKNFEGSVIEWALNPQRSLVQP